MNTNIKTNLIDSALYITTFSIIVCIGAGGFSLPVVCALCFIAVGVDTYRTYLTRTATRKKVLLEIKEEK